MIWEDLYKSTDETATEAQVYLLHMFSLAKLFEHKIVIIFLPTNLNICIVCSKEPSH